MRDVEFRIMIDNDNPGQIEKDKRGEKSEPRDWLSPLRFRKMYNLKGDAHLSSLFIYVYLCNAFVYFRI